MCNSLFSRLVILKLLCQIDCGAGSFSRNYGQHQIWGTLAQVKVKSHWPVVWRIPPCWPASRDHHSFSGRGFSRETLLTPCHLTSCPMEKKHKISSLKIYNCDAWVCSTKTSGTMPIPDSGLAGSNGQAQNLKILNCRLGLALDLPWTRSCVHLPITPALFWQMWLVLPAVACFNCSGGDYGKSDQQCNNVFPNWIFN